MTSLAQDKVLSQNGYGGRIKAGCWAGWPAGWLLAGCWMAGLLLAEWLDGWLLLGWLVVGWLVGEAWTWRLTSYVVVGNGLWIFRLYPTRCQAPVPAPWAKKKKLPGPGPSPGPLDQEKKTPRPRPQSRPFGPRKKLPGPGPSFQNHRKYVLSRSQNMQIQKHYI